MELQDSGMAARAMQELLATEDPPTAVFAAQNLITLGAVAALRGQGLQHTVALVGFDDLPLADAVDPGLTVIAQDAGGLGRAAAETLFARLDGDAEPTRRVVLPTALIARGSGEILPGGAR
jgi:DNA-binding LacI/PurR family transcriptional regulator